MCIFDALSILLIEIFCLAKTVQHAYNTVRECNSHDYAHHLSGVTPNATGYYRENGFNPSPKKYFVLG